MTAGGGVLVSRGVRPALAVLAGILVLLAAAASVLAPANVWSPLVLVPASVLGLAAATTGWVLQGVAQLRQAGLFWTAGGLLLLAAVVGGGGWLDQGLAERLALVAVLCVLPLAVVAFPGPMPTAVRLVMVPLLVVTGALVAVLGTAGVSYGAIQLVVAVAVPAAVWWRFERGMTERRPGPDRDALRLLALGLATTVLLGIPAHSPPTHRH